MPTVSIHWLFPFLLWGSVVTEDGCRWIETYANHPAGSDAEEDALAAQVAAQIRPSEINLIMITEEKRLRFTVSLGC